MAINTPLVIARNFKNYLNRQIFKFPRIIKRLTCNVGHVPKSKCKSKLKLSLLYSLCLLKICQEQTICSNYNL